MTKSVYLKYPNAETFKTMPSVKMILRLIRAFGADKIEPMEKLTAIEIKINGR